VSRTEDLEVNAHCCEWITVLHIIMSFNSPVDAHGRNCFENVQCCKMAT